MEERGEAEGEEGEAAGKREVAEINMMTSSSPRFLEAERPVQDHHIP